MTPRAVAARALAEEVDVAKFRGVLAVVILPTLNEEKGLARTLGDLPLDRFAEPGHRIQPLIIDGGSTDGTLEVARKWNIPVLRQTSRGKGGAMLEAITWVHRMGIPFVVVLDADATYPPDRILPTVDLLRGGTDLVIGIRHPEWGPPSDFKDLSHRVGNVFLSYAASFLAHRPILDLCSGFWGVSTQQFMDLHLDASSFAIEAELVLKSIRRGYSIHQIPVAYRQRLGTAKLRALADGSQILWAILRHARPSRTAAENGQGPASWARDLLSIGIVLGSFGALLECAPSEAAEAGQVARYLQGQLPETRIRIEARAPASPFSPMGSIGASPAWEIDAGTSFFPLSASLPCAGSAAGEARSVSVFIRSQRRRLTIELPSNETAAPGQPTSLSMSRSGGRKLPGLPHRTQFPSLLVVTSRLNFQPERQQQTLLSANGFHPTERPRYLPNPSETRAPMGLPRTM
ncbi:MAG: glycosyltransferase family 2 protein [Thermoplasmata archaeon]|jgi:dolichol-phosphate hexosyltransferase